ncbi:unnamed protein product [Ectocarpus sp. 8 AP-2014]
MSDGDGLHGCVIDVRASSGVQLLHVIGPAESTEDYDAVDKEAEAASNAAARTAEVAAPGPSPSSGRMSPGMGNPTNSVGGNGLGRTHHRLVTGRADPRTSLALYFGGPPKPKNKTKKRAAAAAVGSGSRNEEDEHVVFQFVIRRSSPAGDGRITRVVTHRLPVTDDGHGFLQTVDPEALSVLIGKEAVLRATFGTESGTNQHEVEEARVAVDTVVQEVSSRFRDFRKRQPAAPAAAAAAAAAGAHNNNNSSPSSTTPVLTRPELSPPLPAALRGRGSGGGGGNGSSGGSSSGGGDVGPPSLADAEGGEAGGFSTIASPPLSGSSTDPNSARAAAAAAAAAAAGAGGGWGIGRPEDAVFPPELGRLPRQLFHLRRGPLLGPLLQNSDDPLCLRHLFLRGALEECLRMMEPSLVSLKATEALACLTVAGNGSGGDSGNTAKEGVPTASASAAAAALPFPCSRVPVETLAMLADRVLVRFPDSRRTWHVS